MSKVNLIKIAADTVDLCEFECKDLVREGKNFFYNETTSLIGTTNNSTQSNVVKVVKETTIEALIRNRYKVFGVFNFASAKKPGGGFLNGAVAQEESIARVSTLYSLIKECKEFYVPSSAPYYTDRIIYSTPVYIIKDDFGSLIEPIKCEVITCAASNYSFFDSIDYVQHTKIFTNRVTKVIESAIKNNQRNLILGAWGCGVFQNPPDINASIFRKVIAKYSNNFDEIIFAIPDDKNFEMFNNNL